MHQQQGVRLEHAWRPKFLLGATRRACTAGVGARRPICPLQAPAELLRTGGAVGGATARRGCRSHSCVTQAAILLGRSPSPVRLAHHAPPTRRHGAVVPCAESAHCTVRGRLPDHVLAQRNSASLEGSCCGLRGGDAVLLMYCLVHRRNFPSSRVQAGWTAVERAVAAHSADSTTASRLRSTRLVRHRGRTFREKADGAGPSSAAVVPEPSLRLSAGVVDLEETSRHASSPGAPPALTRARVVAADQRMDATARADCGEPTHAPQKL
ncbi:hypothetical protein SAMN04488548_1342494 [Gordonia westfalica]|uniref:Uncharacterized protein n=1 Tax=Gordonia westfalica TaxID=158898 RepID=A0A1H2JU09_9ACTN|nr:hypothetical protein SAMN04488548_1342494 [Gordonia westfalica]